MLTLFKGATCYVIHRNISMSEVQHGNRLGTKNIDVFWNTGVTDAMALSVVARNGKIYRKILWELLNKTWRPVH